jgi:hypothetical protein
MFVSREKWLLIGACFSRPVFSKLVQESGGKSIPWFEAERFRKENKDRSTDRSLVKSTIDIILFRKAGT